MAIRIRRIDGITVALCAAKTHAKEGDIYLDDSVHHALSTKFSVDWAGEGLLGKDLADEQVKRLMLDTEIQLNESKTNAYSCYEALRNSSSYGRFKP